MNLAIPTSYSMLDQIVSNPAQYGDTVVITFLADEGLTLVPLADDGTLDEPRRLVMDSHQVEDLSMRLKMNPERASQLLAEHLKRDFEGDLHFTLLTSLCLILMGSVMGFSIGLLV